MSDNRRFCSQCGSPNEAGSAFCENCGSKLGRNAAASLPAAAPTSPPASATPAKASRGSNRAVVIPVLLILVAAGAWAMGTPVPSFLSSLGIKSRNSPDSVQLAPYAQNITLSDSTVGGAIPSTALAPTALPASNGSVASTAPAPPSAPSAPVQRNAPTARSTLPVAPQTDGPKPPPLATSVVPFPSDLGAIPKDAEASSGSPSASTRSEPQPAENAAPAQPKAVGKISAGSVISLRSADQVCSDKAQQGTKFTALVQQDVQGENGAVIRKGTPIVFVVAQIKPAAANQNAVFSIASESVQLGGERHAVKASIDAVAIKEKSRGLVGALVGAAAAAAAARAAGGDTKQTVAGSIGGGAAGAVIGSQLKTGNGCIERNSPIRITLTSDITT